MLIIVLANKLANVRRHLGRFTLQGLGFSPKRLFLNLKYSTSSHSGISHFFVKVIFHYKMLISKNFENAEKEGKNYLTLNNQTAILNHLFINVCQEFTICLLMFLSSQDCTIKKIIDLLFQCLFFVRKYLQIISVNPHTNVIKQVI